MIKLVVLEKMFDFLQFCDPKKRNFMRRTKPLDVLQSFPSDTFFTPTLTAGVSGLAHNAVSLNLFTHQTTLASKGGDGRFSKSKLRRHHLAGRDVYRAPGRPVNCTSGALIHLQPSANCNASGAATAHAAAKVVDFFGDDIAGSHDGPGMSAIGGSLRAGKLREGEQGPRHVRIATSMQGRFCDAAATTKIASFNVGGGGTPLQPVASMLR